MPNGSAKVEWACASRRMRTSRHGPHASRRIASQSRRWERLCSHLRCDAPQHEGEARRILAKRTQRAFWPNEAKHARERRTNLRLHEMSAGVVSLFPVVIYNEVCNSHVPVA